MIITRAWMATLTAFAGVLGIILILDLTQYPFYVPRVMIFHYFLLHQDIVGSAMVIFIALAALLPQSRSGALEFVDWLSRHPWKVAAASFVFICIAGRVAAYHHPLAGDEHLAIFMSRAFAAGRLTGELPPELVFRLVPEFYQWRWLIVDEATGRVASMYWPGFALLLAPFSLVGAPWALNPLLAALSLVLVARIATRLSGVPQAGGWAMLFALGSPGFIGMAMSYFSMSAHLFVNALYVWLLLERTPRRLVGAGVVGSVALVMSNPVPHLLFALPWVASVARGPDGRRNFLRLALGYAPLALLLGLGWWLFLRDLQGKTPMSFHASDDDPFHRLANLAWSMFLERWKVFGLWEGAIGSRLLEQARLWSWSVPGLPLVALAGWWLSREIREARLLALSLLCTLLGYLLVVFDQGSGWGARYVHPALSALLVLAALAMVRVTDPALRSYVVRVAVLSLVFLNALRLIQIHAFMRDQLELRPPFEPGVRQIVFIRANPVNYAQDFLQNDPFLRSPVIFMASRGLARDYAEIIQRRYPGARLTYDQPNGQTWRIDP